jgi:hypothetical protein
MRFGWSVACDFFGGKRFLSEFHPKLAIAWYNNEADFSKLNSLLKAFVYRRKGKGFLFSQGAFRVRIIHVW